VILFSLYLHNCFLQYTRFHHSGILTGLPSLSAETPKENWHTGDPDVDPWCWKDRAAEEKRLAFGCILGGYKGFVSPRMYSFFYAALHPKEPMEVRRVSGHISQTVWQLWQLFEEKTMLNTSDIRKEMGVTLKRGDSKVDRAIQEMQQYYYITVAGSRRKTDKYGKPYEWSANVYDKVISYNFVHYNVLTDGRLMYMIKSRTGLRENG